jgi:hypothetical protein
VKLDGFGKRAGHFAGFFEKGPVHPGRGLRNGCQPLQALYGHVWVVGRLSGNVDR